MVLELFLTAKFELRGKNGHGFSAESTYRVTSTDVETRCDLRIAIANKVLFFLLTNYVELVGCCSIRGCLYYIDMQGIHVIIFELFFTG